MTARRRETARSPASATAGRSNSTQRRCGRLRARLPQGSVPSPPPISSRQRCRGTNRPTAPAARSSAATPTSARCMARSPHAAGSAALRSRRIGPVGRQLAAPCSPRSSASGIAQIVIQHRVMFDHRDDAGIAAATPRRADQGRNDRRCGAAASCSDTAASSSSTVGVGRQRQPRRQIRPRSTARPRVDRTISGGRRRAGSANRRSRRRDRRACSRAPPRDRPGQRRKCLQIAGILDSARILSRRPSTRSRKESRATA